MTRMQQQKLVLPLGMSILPKTMAALSQLVLVLVLLLAPPRGTSDRNSGVGFAHGFGLGPIDAGALALASANIDAHVHVHAGIVADALADLPTTMLAALSRGLLDDVPVAAATDAFGFDAPPATLSQAETWALRIGSGVVTYFGFVLATDRPKGQLGVPLVDENNDLDMEGCLKVATSTVPGAGLGLFAARSMPRGTVLGTYPGVVLPLGQHSASSKVRDCPACASYIWRFTDNEFVIDPTDHGDGTLGAVCRGGNPSQPLSVVFFDVLSFLGLWKGASTALCRINEPPKGADVNVVTEEDLESRTVTFTLERDVFSGEELHLDYGLTYDRSGYSRGGGGGGM